jgi:hypothetical protein
MPEMLDEPLGGAARAFSLTPNDDEIIYASAALSAISAACS